MQCNDAMQCNETPGSRRLRLGGPGHQVSGRAPRIALSLVSAFSPFFLLELHSAGILVPLPVSTALERIGVFNN
jgi:hypothetical protein